MTITASNYKGRVWTCDEHNAKIEALITVGQTADAMKLVATVHPKKGNTCKECARLWEDTPPSNR